MNIKAEAAYRRASFDLDTYCLLYVEGKATKRQVDTQASKVRNLLEKYHAKLLKGRHAKLKNK